MKKQYQRPIIRCRKIETSNLLTSSDTSKPQETINIYNNGSSVDPSQSLSKKSNWIFDDDSEDE